MYYVPLKSNPGPPYGKAYGYFKNKPRKEWKNINFTDEDIINLVNLRFISDYYGYDPTQIVKMRNEGKGFVAINNIVRSDKKGKGQSNKKNS